MCQSPESPSNIFDKGFQNICVINNLGYSHKRIFPLCSKIQTFEHKSLRSELEILNAKAFLALKIPLAYPIGF